MESGEAKSQLEKMAKHVAEMSDHIKDMLDEFEREYPTITKPALTFSLHDFTPYEIKDIQEALDFITTDAAPGRGPLRPVIRALEKALEAKTGIEVISRVPPPKPRAIKPQSYDQPPAPVVRTINDLSLEEISRLKERSKLRDPMPHLPDTILKSEDPAKVSAEGARLRDLLRTGNID